MSDSLGALQFIKPTVRTAGASPRATGRMSKHRLQWNENPYDYPDDLKEEVLARMAARAWAHYPDALRPYPLIDKLAARWDVSPEMVVVSSGSSSLIKIILSAVLGPNDRMALCAPTFLLYRRNAGLMGAQLFEVPSDPAADFALPVDDLIVSARTNEAKLIALCAPNNPTGTVYAVDDIRRVIDESGALVIVDEAYAEFCGQNLRPLLDEFDNVILVRTFSKAYAMAGLRVGYALTTPTLARELDKNVNSFPVSTFSAAAAEVALEHSDRFLENVAKVVAERERLAGALRALPGVHVYSSGTNFLLADVGPAADAVFHELRQEHDLLINRMESYPELSNCLRISIGLPEANDRVVAVCAKHVGQ